jgi:hypothetical protein
MKIIGLINFYGLFWTLMFSDYFLRLDYGYIVMILSMKVYGSMKGMLNEEV